MIVGDCAETMRANIVIDGVGVETQRAVVLELLITSGVLFGHLP